MSKTEDTSHSGIACDSKVTITSYGLGAQQLFGWTENEVVGNFLMPIWGPPVLARFSDGSHL